MGPRAPTDGSSVRGSILVRVVKILRSRRERARSLVPHQLHKYLSERINFVDWYPAEDYFELLRSCVLVLVEEGSCTYEDVGATAAEEDMNGVYRSLLRSGDVGRTLSSFATLWRNQYAFGGLNARLDSGSSAIVTLTEPAFSRRQLCPTVYGYIKRAIALAGGTNIRLQHTICVLTGGTKCEWRVSWDGAEQGRAT